MNCVYTVTGYRLASREIKQTMKAYCEQHKGKALIYRDLCSFIIEIVMVFANKLCEHHLT
jgi:hypothetical protein